MDILSSQNMIPCYHLLYHKVQRRIWRISFHNLTHWVRIWISKWGLDEDQSKLIQGEHNWAKAKIRLPLNQLWKFKFKLRHWWINPSNHTIWRKSIVIYINTCWNRAGRALPWSWIRTSNARVKLSWNREHKCFCANLFLKLYL